MDHHNHSDDHNDGGLTADLKTILSRRRVVTLLGVAGAGAIGYLALRGTPGMAEANTLGTAADGSVCVKLPGETAGPYPGDGTNAKDGQTVNVLTQTGILRSDIRPSFGDMTGVAEGVTVDLTISLVDVGNACTPLAGHAIYLWQCDAKGTYSLYTRTDQNWLRGVQITDDLGQVRFTTIFPACYDGRWPHMHFEIFESVEAATIGRDSLLISQFALPEDVSEAVFAADPRYVQSVDNLTRVSLTGDMVFGDNTPEQIAAMTVAFTGDPMGGYVATGTIGIVA